MPDFSKMKEKLKKFQTKGASTYEKVDYEKLYFKPKADKTYSVRILKNKFATDEDFPFTEVVTHNYNAFKKSVPALVMFNENDPIIEFRKQLYEEVRSLEKSKDKQDQKVVEENKQIATRIKPSTKYAFQVIVRGEEEDGVKIWEVGSTTRDAILAIIADEENGDVINIVDGTDFKVEGYTAIMKATNKPYVAVNVSLRRKSSPLSDDADLVEKWLDEQKDPRTIFKKHTYEELKTMLQSYLFPEDVNESDDDEDEVVDKKPSKTVFTKPSIKTPVEDDEDDEDTTPDTGKKSSKTVDKLPFDEDEDETVKKPNPKVSAAKAVKSTSAVDDDEDELSDVIAKPKAVVADKAVERKKRFLKALDEDEE